MIGNGHDIDEQLLQPIGYYEGRDSVLLLVLLLPSPRVQFYREWHIPSDPPSLIPLLLTSDPGASVQAVFAEFVTLVGVRLIPRSNEDSVFPRTKSTPSRIRKSCTVHSTMNVGSFGAHEGT